MCPANQVDVLVIQKLGNDVSPENEAHSPFVLTPPIHAFFGIGPEQITEEALVGYFNGSNDFDDLFEGGEFGTEATVHAEDFFVDDGGNGENVKNVGENFPHFQIIFSFA